MNDQLLWTFTPKDDMTPDELVALLIALAPILRIQLNSFSSYDVLPENVKRHFSMQPISPPVEFL